jgi:hypothetical protein
VVAGGDEGVGDGVRVGRGVGKSGSLNESALLVAVPSTDDWQPVTVVAVAVAAEMATSSPTKAGRVLMPPSVRSMWLE